MEEHKDSHYRYRRWPLFVPVFAVFSLFYYFFLSENNLADSLVWTIFFLTYPLLMIFHLKIVKIRTYKPLGLDLLFAWVLGSLVMYLLMLSYVEGIKWFGALFTFSLYFVYHLFSQSLAYLLFKKNLNKSQKNEGEHTRAV